MAFPVTPCHREALMSPTWTVAARVLPTGRRAMICSVGLGATVAFHLPRSSLKVVPISRAAKFSFFIVCEHCGYSYNGSVSRRPHCIECTAKLHCGTKTEIDESPFGELRVWSCTFECAATLHCGTKTETNESPFGDAIAK
jgi:hypothetical protein